MLKYSYDALNRNYDTSQYIRVGGLDFGEIPKFKHKPIFLSLQVKMDIIWEYGFTKLSSIKQKLLTS